jgi:hypothetical protein
VAAGFLLVGAATASTGDPIALVIGVPIGLVSVWALLRIPFMRVTTTPAGVTVHGFCRRRHIRRADLASVVLEQTDDKGFAQVYAPVLHLQDGGEVLLTQLSGFSTTSRASRSRVGRQVDSLRQCPGETRG